MHDVDHHLLYGILGAIAGAHGAAASRPVYQFEICQDALEGGTEESIVGALRAGFGLPSPAKVESAQLGRRTETVRELDRKSVV